MKININGVTTRDMTVEEITEHERITAKFSEFPPSPEERIAALEEQLKAAKILLGVE